MDFYEVVDQVVALLRQRGLPPQATYVFKHALLQDAAYQSLLKSTRQQVHQRIAPALEVQFPAVAETQPEVVAQHYTAAGVHAQAQPYWQRAGQRALEHSANFEALSHLTRGLEILKDLPDTRERTRQELDLQIALALALHALKGQAAPEVERAYARARTLCKQGEDTSQLFRVLLGRRRSPWPGHWGILTAWPWHSTLPPCSISSGGRPRKPRR